LAPMFVLSIIAQVFEGIKQIFINEILTFVSISLINICCCYSLKGDYYNSHCTGKG